MTRQANCGNCYYRNSGKCCRSAPQVHMQPSYSTQYVIENGYSVTKTVQNGVYPSTLWPNTNSNDWCGDHWSVASTPPKEVPKVRPEKRKRELVL